MEKISGLVLEVFDDPAGEVMKQVFPTLESVPGVIKEAALLSPAERAQLPDDVFALVMRDEDVTIRKYACTDEGVTCLHVEYFLKTAHKLPVEAQKTAAQNLLDACGWYNIEAPEQLRKIASAA